MTSSNDEFLHEIVDALLLGGAAAAALLIEHLAFWDDEVLERESERALKQPSSYILGTATIGAAFSIWALRQRLPAAAAAFWIISGAGGATICTAWWWRRRAVLRDRAQEWNGRIGGLAASKELDSAAWNGRAGA